LHTECLRKVEFAVCSAAESIFVVYAMAVPVCGWLARVVVIEELERGGYFAAKVGWEEEFISL
jgi:hypothetical protein